MRVDEIQQGEITSFELCPIHDSRFEAELRVRGEVRLLFSETTRQPVLRLVDGSEERAYSVRGADARSESELARLMSRSLPRLCWITAVHPRPGQGKTERVSLQVHEFPEELSLTLAMDLGVDEKIVEQVRKRQPQLTTVEAVTDWLAERLLLPPASGDPDGLQRALFSGEVNADAGRRIAFRLLGSGACADVTFGADDRLRVTRLTELRGGGRRDSRRPVQLLRAAMRFCDVTVAGQLRSRARSELDQLVERAGSYLRIWKEYNALEMQSIFRRARALGWLRYSKRSPLPDGAWRFSIEESDRLDQVLGEMSRDTGLDIEAGESLPPELQSAEPANGTELFAPRGFVGEIERVDRGHRTLDMRALDDEDEETPPPPKKGFLFASLKGDRVRLGRREAAWERIAAAACPMPQLGMLIEGAPVPTRRSGQVEPLSPAARAHFKGPPTSRQTEALRVALATPDIALIQGPPGTGKTRTLAALQTRLAELTEQVRGISGQTLLSSFQHDAVENAASATEVFGLPAVKLGRRRGESEEQDGLERWRTERIESVRAQLARLPQRAATTAYRKTRDRAVAYIQSARSLEEAREVLADVTELGREFLPPALCDRLLSMGQELGVVQLPAGDLAAQARVRALQTVRSLRTDAISFADDGSQNAYRALHRLGAVLELTPEERAVLERAAECETEAPTALLVELQALQGALLDRLTASERGRKPPPVLADVAALLAEVTEALREQARSGAGGEEAVLEAYLHDLEHDADGVRAAVMQYTAVLAATCQQAVTRSMARLKGLDEDIVFENVVVDEAARANPLDLFIPMSMARRRIILVADHRQLPHILEPDIELELERSVTKATEEALKRSLFERLFLSLREREKQDGIRRVITLNVQYRMHPVLGAFVSDTFYKDHGEDFTSGVSAEERQHGIAGYGEAVAVWKDIPLHRGSEQAGRSKRRPVEARWIAGECKRILDDHPQLSVGVISFYAAQVDELLLQMQEVGLAAQLDDGERVVAEAYRERSDARGRRSERLRIGTVDAFQGKEFDVVLLSMTRSNDIFPEDERRIRSKWGHLTLVNRLCVAMSRQRCLLIVVGDAAMLTPDGARQHIRGLVDFYALCGGSHGQRI